VDLTLGTSHQQIAFSERDLVACGSAAAQIDYVVRQALATVQETTRITDWPADLADLRSTTMATGSVAMTGFAVAQRTVTDDATLTTDDYAVWCDTTAGAIEITMPSAAGIDGQRFEVKNLTAANAVTITPDGSETIDGAANAVLALQGQTAVLTSDGTNYQRTPNVAAQTGASAAGIAAATDDNVKAALTALQAALAAEGAVTSPA